MGAQRGHRMAIAGQARVATYSAAARKVAVPSRTRNSWQISSCPGPQQRHQVSRVVQFMGAANSSESGAKRRAAAATAGMRVAG